MTNQVDALLMALEKIAALDYTRAATNFAARDAVDIAKSAIDAFQAGRASLPASDWNAAIEAAINSIPGGSICDPQVIADELRALKRQPSVAHSDHPMRHYDRTCPACNQHQGALQFAEHVINAVFEGCDWEGVDLQNLAVKYGLLKPVAMQERCGDECGCADNGAEFPSLCYRKTYRMSGLAEKPEGMG